MPKESQGRCPTSNLPPIVWVTTNDSSGVPGSNLEFQGVILVSLPRQKENCIIGMCFISTRVLSEKNLRFKLVLLHLNFADLYGPGVRLQYRRNDGVIRYLSCLFWSYFSVHCFFFFALFSIFLLLLLPEIVHFFFALPFFFFPFFLLLRKQHFWVLASDLGGPRPLWNRPEHRNPFFFFFSLLEGGARRMRAWTNPFSPLLESCHCYLLVEEFCGEVCGVSLVDWDIGASCYQIGIFPVITSHMENDRVSQNVSQQRSPLTCTLVVCEKGAKIEW